MLSHPFMVRAFEAGSVIAVACGLIGYFVVLRAQVFAGDALSHVAFTAALAALAAGLDLRLGLFAGCALFGAAIAVIGPRGRADDVVIGNAFAWILGLGALSLTLYTTSSSNGVAGVNVLFGSIFGLSRSQAGLATAIGAGVVVAAVVIAPPLLFASVDGSVAAAAGIPVRLLGVIFLALVGVTAGEATQAVGSLLLLGLLAGPAGAAHKLTDRPWLGLLLSAGQAVLSLWAGLILSYNSPRLPPSFSILAVSTGLYVLSHIRPIRVPKAHRNSVAFTRK
ncbi:MAG: metal ABC transporter permease [Acidimicrobiales bacterium]|nr:metal ABC transporter permease [Acidimicrobiales bacterium]